MRSRAQRRSRLRLTLGLLCLSLVLVVCTDCDICVGQCNYCLAAEQGDIDACLHLCAEEACLECEIKFALNEAGLMQCTSADSRISKQSGRGVPEQVEVSGPAACNQPATLGDGSAQASVRTVGRSQTNTAAAQAVCSFNASDTTERACGVNAAFRFLYFGPFPAPPSVPLHVSFYAYEIGAGSALVDAQATVNCGSGDEVLAAGETRTIDAPGVGGPCDLSIDLQARTAEPGEHGVVASLNVRAKKGCISNTSCRQKDPQTPCCGSQSQGCHDCSVGNSCEHDTQCAAGLSCTRFNCSAGNLADPCQTDFDCSDSLVCNDGSCAQPAPCNPVDNQGCASGERCCGVGRVISGVDLNAECCPEGDVPPGELCTLDFRGQDNCTGGFVCAEGRCREICHDVPDSCPLGEACDSDRYGIQNVPGDNAGACLTPP